MYIKYYINIIKTLNPLFIEIRFYLEETDKFYISVQSKSIIITLKIPSPLFLFFLSPKPIKILGSKVTVAMALINSRHSYYDSGNALNITYIRFCLIACPDHTCTSITSLSLSLSVSGQWRVFSGNELGALLGWWMFRCWKQQNSDAAAVKSLYMLSSTVSSKILRAIALKEGFHFEVTHFYLKRVDLNRADHK